MSRKGKVPGEYQGVRDEIRQQQLKMKDMSLKGKLTYFWDYYKIHTFVCIFVLILAVTFIHDITTAKDSVFCAYMFHSSQVSSESLSSSFAEYAELDTENYDCLIDTTMNISLRTYTQYDMAASQKLAALVQAGDLDAAMMDSDVFYNHALSEMFVDLRTILSDEELSRYNDLLYYVDHAEVLRADEDSYYVDDTEEMNNMDVSEEEALEEIAAEAESHRHPENMAEPVPVGIYMTDSPFAQKTGAYQQSVPILGIISTSERIDTGKKYLEFLWDESIDFSQMLEENLY